MMSQSATTSTVMSAASAGPELSNGFKKPVSIGLVGLGTVGSGVYRILSEHPDVRIARIAVRDTKKVRSVPVTELTSDALSIAADPDVDIVVEVMGGEALPYELIKTALQNGKHVVTANKVVIARHGAELFALAAANRVNLLFEAAVAGGIPIVLPLKTSLAGNHIEQIAGILNGTTNYILTRMEQAGMDFQTALREAQQKGFAEADPSADVEGWDAACKIAILAGIAYGKQVDKDRIYCEGISGIDTPDIHMAAELGYAIRLIALAKAPSSQQADLRVHPMLVPLSHPLARILFENNAVWIKGDAVGDVMFYGKGAGELPTASSVAGDILLIAKALQGGEGFLAGIRFDSQEACQLIPVEETRNAYYLRLETADLPGVIGHLGQACGEHKVSLNAVMQRAVDSEAQTATIVLLTHEVAESDFQAALAKIKSLPSTRKVCTVLRVFQP